MRGKFVLAILAVMVMSQAAIGAEEAEKTKGAKSGKAVSHKTISSAMADVWCLKLDQCDKSSGMSSKECKKVLKKSFLRGFNNAAQGQKIEVTQVTLDECFESIKKDDCESLKKAHSLPGCSFISYLNRY